MVSIKGIAMNRENHPENMARSCHVGMYQRKEESSAYMSDPYPTP